MGDKIEAHKVFKAWEMRIWSQWISLVVFGSGPKRQFWSSWTLCAWWLFFITVLPNDKIRWQKAGLLGALYYSAAHFMEINGLFSYW